jgi:hypothetical protein
MEILNIEILLTDGLEVLVMDVPVMDECVKPNENTKNLYQMLDRGIDDMETGRELPVEKAFEMITKLRDARRNEKA